MGLENGAVNAGSQAEIVGINNESAQEVSLAGRNRRPRSTDRIVMARNMGG